jgi:hypothetical protein
MKKYQPAIIEAILNLNEKKAMSLFYFNIPGRLKRLNYFLVPLVSLRILCVKCTQFISHKNCCEKQKAQQILANYKYIIKILINKMIAQSRQ